LGAGHGEVPIPHALVEHRWLPITVTSLVSHLSLYLVLLVALRDVGVSNSQVGWAEVLAVFAFARLATAIPFTPGGVGFVEAVLIAGLTAAGGDRDAVTAAVPVLSRAHLGAADRGRRGHLPLVAPTVADSGDRLVGRPGTGRR
jgi:uncharacterized membrane protein YbhN (UPF0104 family)